MEVKLPYILLFVLSYTFLSALLFFLPSSLLPSPMTPLILTETFIQYSVITLKSQPPSSRILPVPCPIAVKEEVHYHG